MPHMFSPTAQLTSVRPRGDQLAKMPGRLLLWAYSDGPRLLGSLQKRLDVELLLSF